MKLKRGVALAGNERAVLITLKDELDQEYIGVRLNAPGEPDKYLCCVSSLFMKNAIRDNQDLSGYYTAEKSYYVAEGDEEWMKVREIDYRGIPKGWLPGGKPEELLV